MLYDSSYEFLLQNIRKALYWLCKRFCIVEDLFIFFVFKRISANLQGDFDGIGVGAEVVLQRPVCSLGLGDNLAGAKRIDAPCYIQHPTEGIEAAVGFLCIPSY